VFELAAVTVMVVPETLHSAATGAAATPDCTAMQSGAVKAVVMVIVQVVVVITHDPPQLPEAPCRSFGVVMAVTKIGLVDWTAGPVPVEAAAFRSLKFAAVASYTMQAILVARRSLAEESAPLCLAMVMMPSPLKFTVGDPLVLANAGVKQPIVAFAAAHPAEVRVIPGRFMVIEQAMGTPTGRPAGIRYLRRFVEEMKASGLVAAALQRSGQADAAVAPPAPAE